VRSIDETIFPEQQGQTTMSAPTSPGISNPRLLPQQATPEQQPMPSIRFTPHIDIRSNRESLHFSPIERSLRQKDERIKVGRCPDRDNANPNAPVGFKSKVVSRRHCEFWCDNGQWCVKDVKSSSGTFLNHIRLSPPGVESKPFPINDGDILQLGIDFKGGEEQIYRCVKIRVELNRAWQKALNNFKYLPVNSQGCPDTVS
jgi:pSer/pThr/pTyr-binding forkhead associated (FHA) protein